MFDSTILRLPVLGNYTKNDIANIFKKVNEFNEKAIAHEIYYYKNVLKEKFNEELEQEIKENLKVRIGVYWDKGNRISENIEDVLYTLKQNINMIIIENHVKYHSIAKKPPSSSIRIELDFTRDDILDATDPLFMPSLHPSRVEIISEDKEYAEVFANDLKSTLNKANILVRLLHSRIAYLILLFVLIYPLYMWQALNYEKNWAHDAFKDYSAGFSVFFYVFVFLLIVNVFRFIFNLSKYFFPICRFIEENSFQNKLYAIFSVVFIVTLNAIYAAFIGGIALKYIAKLML